MILVVYMIFRISGGYSKSTQSLLASDTGRILPASGFRKLPQAFLGLFRRDGGMVLLHTGGLFLNVVVANIFGRTADLMDDSSLQTAVGIHYLNNLHHAVKTIRAKQLYIQNAPAFEFIQHIHPRFIALMLSEPDAEDVFLPVHGTAQHHISSFGNITVVFFDLIVDGVHKRERIDRL